MLQKYYLLYLAIFVILVFIKFVELKVDGVPSLQNLDTTCLKCLCEAATHCDNTTACVTGYCGPFKMSKIYWVDAGNPTLPNDDPERDGAFEDCAFDYFCSERAVTHYLAKYGKDCNYDGVTNCIDYSMINFNGGWKCDQNLKRNAAGKNWTMRYNQCVGSAGLRL